MRARLWQPVILAACVVAVPRAAAAQGVHWPRQHAEPPLETTVPGALAPMPNPAENPHEAEHTTGEVISRDADGGGYTWDATGFEAHVGADGAVSFRDKSWIRTDDVLVLPGFLMMAGTFDVTELAMREVGQDPYQSAKLRFLEQTFDARAAMRMRSDRVVMARALNRLPGYLGNVWQYQGWSPALRRRILFALWDECAEHGNQLLRTGGAQARATIEAFVRRELPAGSPEGFTDAELEALNRRRTSEHVFDPYGDR